MKLSVLPALATAPNAPVVPATAPQRAETPIAFVRALVAAYTRRSISPLAMLHKAQIAPALLKKPGARVTALQFELASAWAMQELDDEALGWFERPLPWGSYGMLVRASLTAPTLALALARWCRHHNLLTHSIRLRLSQHDGLARLELEEVHDLGELREFCIVSVLRNALGVACWLGDSRMALRAVQLRYAPPAHRRSYGVLFDAPAAFLAEHNALHFDAGYLNLPVRRDEAALQRMLQRALLLTVRPYRRDRLLVEKVRQTLRQYPQQTRRAEDLAERMNLSVRSLHRQLKDEGSSLQQLKDTVRRELATALLLQSQRPLKQIAQAVGFLSEKSFIRAFKGWTGQTPDALRGPPAAPRRARWDPP